MATYRRHGAGWQAQIIRKGYPARYRTFDTKEAAQKWAIQIEADMTKGVYKDPTTALNTTLGDALDRYQREISVRKKGSPGSVANPRLEEFRTRQEIVGTARNG